MSGTPEGQREEPKKPQHTGLSVVDLEGLPPAQRRVWRLLLRHVEMTYTALCEAVDALPEADRLSRSQMDEALEILLKQDWIVKKEGDALTYRVHVRRKAGSGQRVAPPAADAPAPPPADAPASLRPRNKRSLIRGMWDALISKENKTSEKKSDSDS